MTADWGPGNPLFEEHVRRWTDRMMGMSPTLGELQAKHMDKFVTFTVKDREVTGIVSAVSHESFGQWRRTTLWVKTGDRFETFTLPSELGCRMETPYEESLREGVLK